MTIQINYGIITIVEQETEVDDLINRYKQHQNSFSSYSGRSEYSKTLGTKSNSSYRTLKDENKTGNSGKYDRGTLIDAMDMNNAGKQREISNHFYESNILYRRLIHYFADMFTYGWSVYPSIRRKNKLSPDDIEDSWWDTLDYIEAIDPETLGPKISLDVLLNGEVYVVVKESVAGGEEPGTNGEEDETIVGIQHLPINYCRTTKTYRGRDMVDFNVKFFDDQFRNEDDKKMALEIFPKVVSDAYKAYTKQTTKVRGSEWQTLDPDYAFRFSLGKSGKPVIIGALFDVMDLQDVKDITMFKLEQELSKLLVQRFDFDKDGQPNVTLPVMEEFHQSTAAMLEGVAGVDVVTTLAEVFSVDLQKQKEAASNNPLTSANTMLHNGLGVSEQLFNSTTSGALSKSLSVDESFMFSLVKQVETFLNVRLDKNFTKDNIKFRLNILLVTHTNRSDMVKLYKEQTSLGFAKFLPAIALGQRQSDIMSALYFENDVLDLVSLMRPPVSSNTMSAKQQANGSGSGEGPGRPEKNEEDRSEKTIQNRESA